MTLEASRISVVALVVFALAQAAAAGTVTVQGTVNGMDSDDVGTVTVVGIFDVKAGRLYQIVADDRSRPLLGLVGKVIRVTGLASPLAEGVWRLQVRDYQVLGNAPADEALGGGVDGAGDGGGNLGDEAGGAAGGDLGGAGLDGTSAGEGGGTAWQPSPEGATWQTPPDGSTGEAPEAPLRGMPAGPSRPVPAAPSAPAAPAVGAAPASVGDLLPQLFAVGDLTSKKAWREALAACHRIGRQSGLPRWALVDLMASAAECHFALGEREKGLDFLGKAIAQGFDGYHALRGNAGFKGVHTDPTFRDLYGRVRISPVDDYELKWLLAEIMRVNHDTSMMINENMGRKDSGWTQVPQVPVPTRPTASHAVNVLRLCLHFFQRRQKQMVMTSDQSRMSHRTQMGIIGNMGASNRNPWQTQMDGNRRATERLQSAQMAQQRYQQRLQAVRQRQLVLPAGLGTTPAPPPALP